MVHYHGPRSIYPEQNEPNSHLSVHFLSNQTFCDLPFDEVLLVPSLTRKLENHSLLFACALFGVYIMLSITSGGCTFCFQLKDALSCDDRGLMEHG